MAHTLILNASNSQLVIDASPHDLGLDAFPDSSTGVLTQTIPAFAQALTGTVTDKLVQAKTIPAFAQTLTMGHSPAHAVISAAIPAFAQTLRMTSKVKASLSQTINPFGVSLRVINGAIISNVRTRPGTMRAEARPRRVV